MQHRLPEWADLVHRRGAPFRNVVLFIDGSLFQTCRPHPKSFLRLHLRAMGVTADALQRAFYSGHKRHHGMKFHTVTAPNGLFWLYGPEDGRRHDLTLFQNANLFHLITRLSFMGVRYMMYGDSAYPNLPNMGSPIPRVLCPPNSENSIINERMSSCRTVASEWTFGIISNTWQATDFARWKRAFLTRPALQYRVASLLTNCRSCMNDGNTITRWFRGGYDQPIVHVPEFRDYVNGRL